MGNEGSYVTGPYWYTRFPSHIWERVRRMPPIQNNLQSEAKRRTPNWTLKIYFSEINRKIIRSCAYARSKFPEQLDVNQGVLQHSQCPKYHTAEMLPVSFCSDSLCRSSNEDYSIFNTLGLVAICDCFLQNKCIRNTFKPVRWRVYATYNTIFFLRRRRFFSIVVTVGLNDRLWIAGFAQRKHMFIAAQLISAQTLLHCTPYVRVLNALLMPKMYVF